MSALAVLGDEPVVDRNALLRECMDWGRQHLLQRRIRSAESVSKVMLQNALLLAENRNLLEGEPDTLARARTRHADELHDTIRRTDAIDALASARRAGALP